MTAAQPDSFGDSKAGLRRGLQPATATRGNLRPSTCGPLDLGRALTLYRLKGGGPLFAVAWPSTSVFRVRSPRAATISMATEGDPGLPRTALRRSSWRLVGFFFKPIDQQFRRPQQERERAIR